MNKKTNIFKDPYPIIFLLFFIYPIIPFIGKFRTLGAELLIWCIFALSFNLVLGYAGLPSFGHGAFYGVGTYAVALTIMHFYSKGVIILNKKEEGYLLCFINCCFFSNSLRNWI